MVNEVSKYHQSISPEMNDTLDQLEAALLLQPQVECNTYHLFTPKMYSRQIHMPADTLIMSMIHKETHPYEVSMGKACVKINDDPWIEVEAGYHGVTPAGTRRTLLIKENCIWTTYHSIDFVTGEENNLVGEEKTNFLNKIVETIFEKHENPYLKNLAIENIKEGLKDQS